MPANAQPTPRYFRREIVSAMLVAMLLVVLTGSTARAQAIDLTDSEGSASSGSNDSLLTAESIGSLSSGTRRLIRGWVGTSSPADVDFYQFEVEAGPTETFLEVDFADDALGSDDLGAGLDTALWLFDDEGRLIAWNDDSDFFGLEIDNEGTDPGSDTFGQRDSFIGPLTLANGTYYIAIAWYGQAPSAFMQPGLTYQALASSGLSVASATPNAAFPFVTCPTPSNASCQGGYLIDMRTTFVPEPNLVIGLAIGALAIATHRSRPTFTGNTDGMAPVRYD